MALRRATSLLRPVSGVVRQEFRTAQRCMSDRSTFDDKEHAMEDLYIRKAEENLLKRLLEKMEKEEAKKKPVDDKKATKELKKILGDVPEDVAKKLLDWKEKH